MLMATAVFACAVSFASSALLPAPGMRVRATAADNPAVVLSETVDVPPHRRVLRSADFSPAARPLLVTFSGLAAIPREGTYHFSIEAPGRVNLLVGGKPIADTRPDQPPDTQGSIALAAGLVPIEINAIVQPRDRFALSVLWAKEVLAYVPIAPDRVFPPDAPRWRFALARAFDAVACVAALLAAVLGLRLVLPARAFLTAVFAALTVVLALAAALGLLELGLRARGVAPPEYVPGNIWLTYNFAPGKTAKYVGWIPYFTKDFEVEVTMSSTGWRDREYAIAKPAHTTRILVIGDSFVEAKEVRLEETFHELLETRLNRTAAEKGRRYEVIALGRADTGTRKQLETLEQVGLPFQPDVVVLTFFAGNDIQDNSPELTAQFRAWSRRIFGERILASKVACIDSTLRFQWSWLNRFLADGLCALYLQNLHHFRTDLPKSAMIPPLTTIYQRRPYDAKWEEAWNATFRAVSGMKAAAAGAGARFYVMFVHSVLIPGVDRKSIEQGTNPEYDARRPIDRMLEFCAKESIPCLDLEPTMRRHREAGGAPYVWQHDAHWNAEGHQLAADSLQAFLGEHGEIPTELPLAAPN